MMHTKGTTIFAEYDITQNLDPKRSMNSSVSNLGMRLKNSSAGENRALFISKCKRTLESFTKHYNKYTYSNQH